MRMERKKPAKRYKHLVIEEGIAEEFKELADLLQMQQSGLLRRMIKKAKDKGEIGIDLNW
jgi:hypothetical protein